MSKPSIDYLVNAWRLPIIQCNANCKLLLIS